MFETDKSPLPALLRHPAPPVPSHRGSTRAGKPGGDSAAAEVARLRRRVSQQDEALIHLTRALLTLRTGSKALQDENRELHAQLAAARSRRHRSQPD